MTHGKPALGRENHAFGDIGWSAGKPAPDDLFGLTAAVHVGRIHEGAACFDEAIELFMRAGLIGLDSEGHGSQAERRNRAAAAPEMR